MRFTNDVLLLAIAFQQESLEKQNDHLHLCYKKWFYAQLSELEKSRCKRQIPRCTLFLPSESPWQRAYNSESDQAMVTLTGLDCSSFAYIFARFHTLFPQLHTIFKERYNFS